MNHMEVYQNETHISKQEREWTSWFKTVEAMLGHSLDGDQANDGYSMDYAYDWFLTGAKTAEYVTEVRKAKASRK